MLYARKRTICRRNDPMAVGVILLEHLTLSEKEIAHG